MGSLSIFNLNGTAQKLYNDIAKIAPIYDYHCHLSPKEIAEDKEFENVSVLLLGGDHYKWRAMRYTGAKEEFVTGSGDNKEKFKVWAKTCERLIGSPLQHWSALELSMFFGIEEGLTAKNAEEIYEKCNAVIKEKKLSPRKLIEQSGVKLICTTDDPIDDLQYHKAIAEDPSVSYKVLPTFRPDKALNLKNEAYVEYVQNLGAVFGYELKSYDELLAALKSRVEFFAKAGCKLSDHSLESLRYFETNHEEVAQIYHQRINGGSADHITAEQNDKFKMYTLQQLAKWYCENNFVMQLHIGALRNTNTLMHKKLGVDAGYDIMNDFSLAEPLVKLLDGMNLEGALPKTVLYTLNAKDYAVLSTLPLCYTEEGVAGKVQFGAAWWHFDTKQGMLDQLRFSAETNTLASFVGMLTDSRSFLSYARHDYFRRILCSFLGEIMDNGEYFGSDEALKDIVEGICYKNIKNYLEL